MDRAVRTRAACLSLLAVAVVHAQARGENVRVDVVVADAMYRVFPDDLSLKGEDRVGIQLARGEAESFQIVVINRGREVLRGIDLETPPMSPGGRPEPFLTLYREHYVQVQTPTYRSQARPGFYSDGLIPFVDPWTKRAPVGGQYRAGGFDLQPGQCQPYWVDVTVPRGAKAGSYRGEVRITAQGYRKSIPVTVRVLDFDLPEVASLNNAFEMFYWVCDNHAVQRESPHCEALLDRYRQLFVEHRMAVYVLPAVPCDQMTGRARIDRAYLGRVRDFVNRYKPRTCQLPLTVDWPFNDPFGKDLGKLEVYLGDIDTLLRQNPWIPPVFVYVIDEPSTPERFEGARKLGRILHQRKMSVKSLAPVDRRAYPAWSSLEGAVDIWVMQWKTWDAAKAAARKAAGEQVWCYTALTYADKPTLVWHLDAPLLHYMVPFWTAWSLNLDGILYWSPVTKIDGEDPWRNPVSHRVGKEVFNGEGRLIYPGVQAGIDGPVPTIRLKMIRDGLDCYDYLQVLADTGGREVADRIARRLSPSFFQWDPDYREYQKARAELAAAIVERKGRGVTTRPASTPSAAASNPLPGMN